MSEPRPAEDGEPVPFVPDDCAPELSETELVADIWSAQSRQSREYAMELQAIARLAHRRRGVDGMARGARGGPGVDARAMATPELDDISEAFVSEVALIRGCTDAQALVMARESILLTTTLAPSWSELFAGRIGLPHVKVLVDLLGDATPEIAGEVQRQVLPHVEGMTAPDLRTKARRLLYRLDAEAKERRRREAALRADVHVWRIGDGMSRLSIDLPTPQAVACADALDQYARWLRGDGDDRPIGVLRTAVAADLMLRPWDTSRPPVTARLTIHAALPALRPDGHPAQSQEPAEVDGQVVSAAQCRDLLRDLDMLGLGTPPPQGGGIQVAIGDPSTGELLTVATRAGLRRGGGRGHRRRVRRRGAARTAPAADGPGLSTPPPTTAYRPTAPQKRFVRTRDRRCRMPGCNRRPGRCDIDHVTAYRDGGPTACWNLCCLCRRHHRIKTFARGWNFELLPNGWLIVRTPSGVSRLDRPPGWCYDTEPAPPWLDDLAPPDPMLT
jgi:hypothetical protein